MATTGKHTNGKVGGKRASVVSKGGGKGHSTMTKKGLGAQPIHGSGAMSSQSTKSRRV